MRQDGCAEFISISLRIVPQKKTPMWASFLILPAAPAEAGGSPLCRTPAGGGESVHIFRGRKRVLVLGKVRADGALTRRVSAAGCCTAQSASVPCAFRDAVGCFGHCVLHGEVWRRSLPPAPRSSALRHGPPMPRRGAGGGYLNSPHRECLYHVLGSVCGYTQRGCAASLFICT